MTRKICPVCDMPLEGGCYCKLCRRIVLQPVVREQNYYLNERKPEESAEIRTGKSAQSGMRGSRWSVTGKSAQSGMRGSRWSVTGKSAQSEMRGSGWSVTGKSAQSGMRGSRWSVTGKSARPGMTGRGFSSREVKKSGVPGNGRTFGNWSEQTSRGDRASRAPRKTKRDLISLAPVAIGISMSLLAVVGVRTFESSSSATEVIETDWKEEYNNFSQELDEETARLRGVSCTLYDHSSIKREAMVNVVREFMTQKGIAVWEENFYTNNQEYFHGDGSQSSSYQSKVMLDFTTGSEQEMWDWDSSIEICYDTATEELHGVCLSTSDLEFAVGFAENFGRMMDQADNTESLDQEELEQGIRSYWEERDSEVGNWLEGDNWSIETYLSDGVLSLYILAEERMPEQKESREQEDIQ